MVVNVLEDITIDLASRVLSQVEANQDPEITVNIMSRGGDMMAGNAIIKALELSPAKKTTKVFGVAASMGAAISQVGDVRLIAEDAIFQPHNGAGILPGRPTKENLQETINQLEVMDNILLKSFKKSNLNEAQLRDLLVQDKPLTAGKAIDMAFFDDKLEPVKAAAYLNQIIMSEKKSIQERLSALVTKWVPTAVEDAIVEPTPIETPGETVEVEAPVTRAEFDKLLQLVESLIEKMSPLDTPSVTETVTAQLNTWLKGIESKEVMPQASNTMLPEVKVEDEPEGGWINARIQENKSKFEKKRNHEN